MKDAADSCQPIGSDTGSRILSLPVRTLEELESDADLQKGIEWLVQGMIPAGALTVVYGIGKSGKTTLLAHLASAVVSGTPFLDAATRQGPVLWLDMEQHVSLTRQKLLSVGAAHKDYSLWVYNGGAPKLDDLTKVIEETKPVLVVVDSLSVLLGLRDENDASEVTKRIEPVLRLARHSEAAFIAVHHERKREGEAGRGLRGSSAFLAALDVAIQFSKEKGEETKRVMRFIGRYDELPKVLGVRLTDEGYLLDGETVTLTDVAVAEALATLGPTTAEAIARHMSKSRGAILPRLKNLVDQGKATRTGTGKKGDPHLFLPTLVAGIVVAP